MSIKQNGGVFGRNPTFNDLTIEGDLILNGEVFTGLDFQGSWNASTNSPSLASSTGTNGEFYIVSVAGTTNLNGITNWGIGDWAIFNGTVWQRVEGGADGNFDALTANSLVVTGTSYIQSTTAPQLELAYNSGNITGFYRSGGDFQIKNDNGAGSPETSIVLAEDGAVTLYHDANPKIATTSGGCDITGSLSADGAILSGNLELNYAYPRIKLTDTDHNSDYSIINNNGEFGIFDDTNNAYRLNVSASGDVSIPSGNLDVTGDIAVSGNITTDGLVHKDDSNTYVKFLPDRIYMDVGGQRRIDAEVNSTKILNENTIKLQTGSSITDGLVIDASQNVSIPNGSLSVDGAITATTADNNPQITLISTDADANVGPVLKLYRNSASPADNDAVGRLLFTGEDDAGNEATYARIEITATDVSNGSENAKMDFYVAVNDSFAPSLTLENNNVSIPSGDLTVIGKLKVDKNSAGNTGITNCDLQITRDSSSNIGLRTLSNGEVIRFVHTATDVGSIDITTSATSYNTSSDYRLKEDWQPMSGATDRLKELKPVNFAWKADGSRVDGFLAHEAQEVVPESVTGSKDAMMTEEYEVSPATGDIYTPEVVAVEGVEAVEYVAPQGEVLDEDGNVVTEAVAEVMAVEAVEAVEGVAEVIHSANVEQPSELEDGQLWRETTAQVMGDREVPDYQGIDQAKLVPLLVATIQELEARITALES